MGDYHQLSQNATDSGLLSETRTRFQPPQVPSTGSTVSAMA
jgi:hypothetical protein